MQALRRLADSPTLDSLNFSWTLEDGRFEKWLVAGLIRQQPQASTDAFGAQTFRTGPFFKEVREGSWNGVKLCEPQRQFLLHFFQGSSLIINSQGKVVQGLNPYVRPPQTGAWALTGQLFEIIEEIKNSPQKGLTELQTFFGSLIEAKLLEDLKKAVVLSFRAQGRTFDQCLQEALPRSVFYRLKAHLDEVAHAPTLQPAVEHQTIDIQQEKEEPLPENSIMTVAPMSKIGLGLKDWADRWIQGLQGEGFWGWSFSRRQILLFATPPRPYYRP